MNRVLAFHKEEIIDQVPVWQQRLGPDASVGGQDIGLLDLRDEPLQVMNKQCLTKGAAHFHPAFVKVFARELPEPAEGQGLPCVAKRKIHLVVTLPLKGEHGIGAGMH